MGTPVAPASSGWAGRSPAAPRNIPGLGFDTMPAHPPALKDALRFLLRSPRTAGAAVLCIALGTAAVSAVASLLAAALLRPLPFPEGDRLVRVWVSEQGGADREGVAVADLEDLRGLEAFDRVEGASRERLTFVGEDGGRRVEGEGVTGGYLELTGATPVRGRLFTAEEHAGGGPPVMILTHEAWGRLFAFSDSAIGAAVRTPEAVYTVVGVVERGFGGTIEEDSGDIEFLVPLAVDAEATSVRSPGALWTVARRAPGVTDERVREQVTALGQRLAADFPDERTRTALWAEPMSENWRGDLRQGLWLLLGAAALLLVVAAANVAGLMLAHGLSRRRELAVRAALGASRGERVRLLVLEALSVVVVGGAVGLLLGPVLLQAFAAVVTVPIPAYISLEMDGRALALTLLVLGGTALVATLVPALAASGVRPDEAIHVGVRSRSGDRGERRLGRGLIVIQVALATVLVSSTALLLRSYGQLQDAELGFRTRGMLRVAFFMNPVDAPETTDVRALRERAGEAIAGLSGVEAVGRVWPTAPLVAAPQTSIFYPGMDGPTAERGENASLYAADSRFFSVMEIPVIAGRGIEPSDREDTGPVAVVSASLAERLGGLQVAVGRTIEIMGTERRVVGVVADARLTGPRAPAWEQRMVVLPLAQFPNRTVSFAIRTAYDEPEAALPDVRRALAELAPSSALDWTDSFENGLGDAFQRDRFLVALVGVFSGATLALAVLGLLALLAYNVARARVDIGVRQALGATRARIVAEVVGRALVLVGLGLTLGLGLSAAAGRLLEGLLYGVGTLDAPAFAATAAVLLLAALLASAAPARHATRVSPATAMRGE